MDTRTPRTPDPSGRRPGDTPRGSPSGFFDDEPVLSSVKVPSDPAQVVVNHASFRVALAESGRSAGAVPMPGPAATAGLVPARRGVAAGTGRLPAVADADAASTGAPAKRRAPVVWTGRTESDDSFAAELLRAARTGSPAAARTDQLAGADRSAGAATATQLLPRVGGAPGAPPGPGTGRTPGSTPTGPPTVVGPRSPEPPETTQPQRLLRGVRPSEGAYDDQGAEDDTLGGTRLLGTVPSDGRSGSVARDGRDGLGGADGADGSELHGHTGRFARAHTGADRAGGQEAKRQAYYPGRRMNLGVVLLPLRVFLGFITIYAGMGKLCDPVYFDGGKRGSMVKWLHSLEPWTIAEPLRDFALAHPVGAGLTVAFLQVIVGVLTVCGLWQRLAASFGALLSAALLMTVSWSSVPAYDAPDIIYLAAWSPLIIAGAPVYSIDARLATDAWRKLGPRVDLWDLRRRVLRRGGTIAAVVAGLSLLIGSLLGGAVRSTQTATVPGPGEPPTNHLPGSPLPRSPQDDHTSRGRSPDGEGVRGTQRGTGRHRSADPSASPSPGERHHRHRDPSQPSQHETVQAPQQTAPGTPPKQSSPGGGAGGGGGAGSSGSDSETTGGSDGTSGGSSSGGDNGGSSSGGNGGGLGGLLG